MIKHEFEWGEDEFADDPICVRCTKPFSLHDERVGITAEDEMVTVYDDRYLDIFGDIRYRSDDW